MKERVSKQIAQLRVIFESAEAKEKERAWRCIRPGVVVCARGGAHHALSAPLPCAAIPGEWLKNQNHGELDDMKLVDGVTGDTLIYKRRGEPDKQLGLHQQKPVRAVNM